MYIISCIHDICIHDVHIWYIQVSYICNNNRRRIYVYIYVTYMLQSRLKDCVGWRKKSNIQGRTFLSPKAVLKTALGDKKVRPWMLALSLLLYSHDISHIIYLYMYIHHMYIIYTSYMSHIYLCDICIIHAWSMFESMRGVYVECMIYVWCTYIYIYAVHVYDIYMYVNVIHMIWYMHMTCDTCIRHIYMIHV